MWDTRCLFFIATRRRAARARFTDFQSHEKRREKKRKEKKRKTSRRRKTRGRGLKLCGSRERERERRAWLGLVMKFGPDLASL